MTKPTLVWIGISLQKNAEGAFDRRFVSGRVLEKVENLLTGFCHVKTNLVDFAPMDGGAKLRYPTGLEILDGRKQLMNTFEEIKPVAIIAMGSLVTKHLGKMFNVEAVFPKTFDYQCFKNKWPLIPVHHPAYIAVYKRKQEDVYIKSVVDVIMRNFERKL